MRKKIFLIFGIILVISILILMITVFIDKKTNLKDKIEDSDKQEIIDKIEKKLKEIGTKKKDLNFNDLIEDCISIKQKGKVIYAQEKTIDNITEYIGNGYKIKQYYGGECIEWVVYNNKDEIIWEYLKTYPLEKSN